MRRVQQRAERRELAALERRHRGVHALVLADHVAHAPVERIGEARGVVGVAQRLEAEQLERARGTPRGARCSPRPRGFATRRSRAWRARGRAGRARPCAPRACACRAAGRAPPRRAATRAGRAGPSPGPAHSLSTREHSRASLTGRGGSAPAARVAGRARAPRRAPPRRRGPARCGRSLVDARAGTPGSSTPARRSSASVPSQEAVAVLEVRAATSPPSCNSAVTVTPSSIANGRQSPSL